MISKNKHTSKNNCVPIIYNGYPTHIGTQRNIFVQNRHIRGIPAHGIMWECNNDVEKSNDITVGWYWPKHIMKYLVIDNDVRVFFMISQKDLYGLLWLHL